MRNQDSLQVGHVIARILMISPEQNELLRRNRSRIFIWPENESVIDSMIFQAYRPVEDFIDAAARAIQMAGLSDNTGAAENQLKPVHNAQFAGGMLQQHLQSTGWLTNEDGQVFDLVVEVEIENEQLPQPDITTYNADLLEGSDGSENPLCLVVDTSQLSYIYRETEDQEIETEAQSEAEVVELPTEEAGQQEEVSADEDRQRMAARKPQENDNEPDRTRQPGKPGRIRDPMTDMRLKANRARFLARRPQDGDDHPDGTGGGAGSRTTSHGGSGSRQTSRTRSSGGNQAQAAAGFGTWADGTPRTIPPVKKDGTPRKKPGPKIGTKYKEAA